MWLLWHDKKINMFDRFLIAPKRKFESDSTAVGLWKELRQLENVHTSHASSKTQALLATRLKSAEARLQIQYCRTTFKINIASASKTSTP